MINLLRLTCIVALTTLVGCGFQLRGQPTAQGEAELETQPIKVVGVSPYSEFSRQLNQALANFGLDNSAEADTTLIVKPPEFSQNTLTMGESLRIADYDIRATVKYQLIFKNDPNSPVDELAASDEFDRLIEASQRIEYDPESPLASRAERDTVERELEQTLAMRLAQRISLRVQALQN
jgi:outer membrane lipopolysaccharide assembly protein LptE/RlpB